MSTEEHGARQPSEDDRLRVAEIRHRRAYSVYGEGTAYQDIGWLLDALSRAAVPDAATEREIATIEEHREKWMARAFRAEAERDAATEELENFKSLVRLREFEIDNLDELITELKAERDTALAAIARVRAINTGNNRALYGNDFEAGMAKALWLVKTALDGAPEPEWEYAVALAHDCIAEPRYPSAEAATSAARQWPMTARPARRRKAGPWEPLPAQPN